ncbi:MAG TPA: nuclear transport factor 2 family protein [Trebonia sp.]|nr:nuclear transport factor 2 family protein [Trebonia sp.]
MSQPNHAIAEAYLAAVTAGDLPDSLLTDDMTAWLTTQGAVSKSEYQGAIRFLAKLCQSPILFRVDAITAQDDRVVIEARSEATLVDGQQYANTYVFSLRLRDGRIAWIAEHFNPLIAKEKLFPLAASLR